MTKASRIQACLMHGVGAWIGIVSGACLVWDSPASDWGECFQLRFGAIFGSPFLALLTLAGAILGMQFPLAIHRRCQFLLNFVSGMAGLLSAAIALFFLYLHSKNLVNSALFLFALLLSSLFFQAGGCWLALRVKFLE